MPTITATPFINLSYVLVETDWADIPAATCIRVVRVSVVDGKETPLRPYVAPCGESGEFLELSGGHATFWDTEAPLDTAFFYRAEASDFALLDHEIRDSFSRTLTNEWNPGVDTGQTWTLESGGGLADFDVGAGVGTIALGAVNNSRRSSIGSNISDADVYRDVLIPVTATGAAIQSAVMTRYIDTGNMYRYQAAFETTGLITLSIIRRIAAADTTVATLATGISYSPGDWFTVRGKVMGTSHMAKIWLRGTTEPSAWMVTGTDSSVLVAGKVGGREILAAGNTNALPVTLSVDNFLAVVDFVVTETEPLTMPSNGYFWLKDPVRPCLDRRLTTSKMLTPDCPPGLGLFFISMDTEGYNPNAIQVLPTNSPDLIHVSRSRSKVSSTLTIATRTFQDRDDALTLNAAGGPLLFQAAPDYGIPDRYMGIGTIGVTRGLPDHRYQARIVTMPFAEVLRPVGTTQGICGSRFMDLCDIYSTWEEMEDAGLTYESLIAGAASPPAEGFNSWDDIEAGYADWDAVEAAFPTWGDVAGGP